MVFTFGIEFVSLGLQTSKILTFFGNNQLEFLDFGDVIGTESFTAYIHLHLKRRMVGLGLAEKENGGNGGTERRVIITDTLLRFLHLLRK